MVSAPAWGEEEHGISDHLGKPGLPQLLQLFSLQELLCSWSTNAIQFPAELFKLTTWNCPWSSWNGILDHVQYLQQVKLGYYDKQLIGNTYVIKYKMLRHLITTWLKRSIFAIIITWYFTNCLEMLCNVNSLTHKHFWYRQPVFGTLNLSFSTGLYLKSETPRFILLLWQSAGLLTPIWLRHDIAIFVLEPCGPHVERILRRKLLFPASIMNSKWYIQAN